LKKQTATKPIVVKEQGSMVEHVEIICRLAYGSKLKDELFEQAKPSLDKISSFFGFTPMETIIFCVVLNLNFSNESVNIHEFARFVDCSPIRAFALQKEFDALADPTKQIFKILHESSNRKRIRQKSKLCQVEYYVDDEIISNCILGGEVFKPKGAKKSSDLFEFFMAINEVFVGVIDGFTPVHEAYADIQNIFSYNSHLQFVMDVKKEMLEKDPLVLFLACCSEFLDDLGEINIAKIITSLYQTDLRQQMKVRQSILNNTNPLIEKGLISVELGTFRSDSYAELTERALNILLPEMDFTKPKSRHDKNQVSIAASSIAEKRLYFDPDLQKQLNFLTDALQPKNYDNLVGRLIEVGMRTGVCALLHGGPGTGKTEFVNQLARQTGRDLHPVSIAETKNKFFGESEKQILKVFKNYRTSLERSQVVPILFLNEADGILSTRKRIGSSAIDQTENSIQNIILQEMEDLNGIMICTTNLVTNLDPAFERRFLYKIKFEKPSIQAKQSIWQDKIATLSESEAMNLAQEFDFSGGAIENIARKVLMSGVLNGRLPDLSEILGMCREESLYKRKETRRIGYLQ
jgi:ATPase family associated with various cellular activities (AAA)